MPTLFLQKKNFFLLISVVMLLMYAPVFKASYSDDDWRTAGQNEQVKKGFDGIHEIWTTSWAQSRDKSNFTNNWEYRPMAKTSFAIEYGIFGDQPSIAHFFNLIYFLLLLFLIHETLIAIGLDTWAVKLGILILLLHPLTVEAVANLKNREILFAYLFAFLAGFTLHSKSSFIVKIAAFLLFSVFSILSKVQALPLILVFPLYHAVKDQQWVKWLMVDAILILVSIGIILQFPNERTYLYWENPLFFESSITLRFETFLKTVGFYWSKFFIPTGLMHYYGYDIFDRGNLFTIYSFMGLSGLSVLAYYVVVYRKKLFMLLHVISFLLIAAPVSNLVIPAAGIVGDRFGFMFPFYFFLLLYILTESIWKKYKLTFTYLLVAVCFLFSVLSFQRSKDWKNYYQTYTASLRHGEHSAKVQSMAAQQFMKMSGNPELSPFEQSQMLDTALHCLEKALEILPSMEGMHNNIGYLYTKKSKYADAEKQYVMELSKNPFYVNAYLNLAFERIRAGKTRQATAVYFYLHNNRNKMIGRYFDTEYYDEFYAVSKMSGDSLWVAPICRDNGSYIP